MNLFIEYFDWNNGLTKQCFFDNNLIILGVNAEQKTKQVIIKLRPVYYAISLLNVIYQKQYILYSYKKYSIINYVKWKNAKSYFSDCKRIN